MTYDGTRVPMSMERLSTQHPEVADEYLLELLSSISNHFRDTRRGDQSLLTLHSAFVPPKERARFNYLTMTRQMLSNLSPHSMLIARELGAKMKSLTVPPTFYRERFTTFGHRKHVYCLAFDKTHRRLFTGSNDCLVKVWCTRTGYLIYTIRGHQDAVNVITINEDNTLVATASADGYIRVWKMDGYEPVFNYRVKSSRLKPFTSVNFSPSPRPETRYLLATNRDGVVRLWEWDRDDLTFSDPETPIVFRCKFNPKDRLRCSSFNYTGTKFAVAGDDGFVYVFSTIKVDTGYSGPANDSGAASQDQDRPYGRSKPRVPSALFPNKSGQTLSQPVIPIAHLEGHMGSVSDIEYSHDGQRILSGCEDGTARIWSCDVKTNTWNSIVLDIKKTPPPDTTIVSPFDKTSSQRVEDRQPSTSEIASDASEFGTCAPLLEADHSSMEETSLADYPTNANIATENAEPGPPKVSMIAWTADDRYCIVATTSGDIRIYHAHSGELACVLKGHTGDLYELDNHPQNPSVVLSVGEEGNVILWDLQRKTVISHRHYNRSFLDCKFSKDGLKYAVSDQAGCCSLFGIGGLDKDCEQVKEWHRGQFFSTDYKGLRHFSDGTFEDETEHEPPHMLPALPIGGFGMGFAYENQKAVGYGRDIPTHSDSFKLDNLKREACYKLEEREIQAVGVIILPEVDEARVKLRRRDFVEIDNEEEPETTVVAVPTSPIQLPELLPDDPNDEDYYEANREGNNSTDSENSGGEQASDDFASDDAVDAVDDDNEEGRVTRSMAGQHRWTPSPGGAASSSRAHLGRPSGRGRRRGSGRGRGRGRPSSSSRAAQNVRKRRRELSEPSEDDDDDGTLQRQRRRRTVRSYLESDLEDNDELLEITGFDSLSETDAQPSEESENEHPTMSLRTRTRNSAESSSHVTADRKGKRKLRSTASSDEDFAEPSSSSRQSVQRAHKAKGPARQAGRPVRGQLRDLTPAEIQLHKPTEWISTTVRTLSKYLPQLGDRVAIMTEGHQQYWEKSEMIELFDENHGPLGSKEPVEFGIVESISWLVGPPAFCRLKLRIQRLENVQGALLEQEDPVWSSNAREVTIDYSDEDDCPEFLVLWERFLASMEMFNSPSKLQAGQKVDAIYDDGKKYTGMIESISSDGMFWKRAKMQSPWACYHVIWDDDKSPPEDLCPWEVVPSGEDFRRRYNVGKTMTRQEIQRARDVLDWLMSMNDFVLYIDQVDYETYTNYLSQVAYPICLDMVKERLNSKFYRQKEAAIDDIELLRKNAQKYNLETSLANKNAVRLANFFKSRMENPQMPLSITKGRAKKPLIIESDDEYHEDEDPAVESEDSAPAERERAALDDDEDDEEDYIDDDDDDDYY